MAKERDISLDFTVYRKQYNEALANFLNDETMSEVFLNEGYKLGRDAIAKDIGILNVAAIHHDSLIEYLENIDLDKHLKIVHKGSLFLEEILASFQMVDEKFRQAINLLNQRSIEYAGRARERKLAVQTLQNSLLEKEALLKEVYHRVKNNLQVVSSLLNLQAETTQVKSIKDVLIESSTRVKSMALIHEMLYQSDNLAKIDMKIYINNLFKYLFQIYDISANQIKLTTDIDKILLAIDNAIPCGLIINELVANVLKHAFLDNRSGNITFSFKKCDANIVLIISDDGVGVPIGIDIKNTTSLGMRLIHGLTKQLGGTINLDSEKRNTFTLIFADNTQKP